MIIVFRYKQEQSSDFALFIYSADNGKTVCNKAVSEHGDYQKIAHISPAGNVRFYDNISISTFGLREIYKTARKMKKSFIKNFEHLPTNRQYEEILDNIPHNVYRDFINNALPISKILPVMRAYYYTVA